MLLLTCGTFQSHWNSLLYQLTWNWLQFFEDWKATLLKKKKRNINCSAVESTLQLLADKLATLCVRHCAVCTFSWSSLWFLNNASLSPPIDHLLLATQTHTQLMSVFVRPFWHWWHIIIIIIVFTTVGHSVRTNWLLLLLQGDWHRSPRPVSSEVNRSQDSKDSKVELRDINTDWMTDWRLSLSPFPSKYV